MRSPHKRHTALGLVVLALAISGCGGGGSPPSSSHAPPDNNPDPHLIPLSVGAEQRFTVGQSGPSFYRFTTGEPGVYSIGLDTRLNGQVGRAFSDMFWILYATPDFSNFLLFCDDFKGGVANEECALTLEGNTPYYFLVNHFDSLGDEYSLTVSYGGPVAAGGEGGAGTPGAPVEAPAAVSIASGRPAYLKFMQDGTGNVQIAANPQGTNAGFSSVTWSINSDIGFQEDHIIKRCERRQGAHAETCSFSGLPAGEWYLQVDQHTDLPVDVALSITNYGERVDEGSFDAPVPLALNTPRFSQVSSVGLSLYRFTSTVAGRYTVTLGNPHDALGFDLSDAAGDPLPVNGFGFVDPYHGIDRGASANLEADATYTIRVFELHGAGSDFMLEVTSP